MATGLLCGLTLGCLPGGDDEHRSGPRFPLSNVEAKADRLDFGVQDMRASGDYRVATTATVLPTSAPQATADAPPPVIEPVSAGDGLSKFFEALTAVDRGERDQPVTILHLGDQHIAADRLTSELRQRFQARFGDAGRGFMAPGLFRVARGTIERAGDWRAASSASGDAGPFGLSGVRLTGRNGAVLKLSLPEAPFDWAEITFATDPETGKAHVAVDDQGGTVSTRTATPTWQRIKINAAGTTLTVRAETERPVHLLSWSLVREAAGLRYVNLGVPGATAHTHRKWDEDFVAADLERIAPDLIIIGYGTNEAFDDALDADSYGEGVRALFDRLRAAAPQASLLMVGPPDVARMPDYAALEGADACRALTGEEHADYAALLQARSRRLGRWHPPPNLRTVRQVLRRVASQMGAYYWDWSAFMGGQCSVHAWVHSQPPLATPDHRHLTAEGARRSARALFQDVMQAFEAYRAGAARAAK